MENQTDNGRPRFYRRRYITGGIGIAMLLILCGVVFLFINMGVIPEIYKPLIISWQALLIFIGVCKLFAKHLISGILLILIGAIFLVPVLGNVFPGYFAGYDLSFRTYWPVVLIVAGIGIIAAVLSPRKHRRRCPRHHRNGKDREFYVSDPDENYIEKKIAFNSSEQIVLSQNFSGGDISVTFGDFMLDLRKASFDKANIGLKLNAAFSNITILVPPDWDINLNNNCIFGAIEDKRHFVQTVAGQKQLYIEANCVFGNIELKD